MDSNIINTRSIRAASVEEEEEGDKQAGSTGG